MAAVRQEQDFPMSLHFRCSFASCTCRWSAHHSHHFSTFHSSDRRLHTEPNSATPTSIPSCRAIRFCVLYMTKYLTTNVFRNYRMVVFIEVIRTVQLQVTVVETEKCQSNRPVFFLLFFFNCFTVHFCSLSFLPTYALTYIIKTSQAVTLIAHFTPTCFDP